MFCRKTTATGEVDLRARIGGALECDAGTFTNADAVALNATRGTLRAACSAGESPPPARLTCGAPTSAAS